MHSSSKQKSRHQKIALVLKKNLKKRKIFQNKNNKENKKINK
tara:strand:- start:220 stop:345 length:126 start_codon:yes stop_codon:yes gene_type:complete